VLVALDVYRNPTQARGCDLETNARSRRFVVEEQSGREVTIRDRVDARELLCRRDEIKDPFAPEVANTDQVSL
jgi:hypothetical protein